MSWDGWLWECRKWSLQSFYELRKNFINDNKLWLYDQELCQNFSIFFSNFWTDFPEFDCSTKDNSPCQQKACLCDVEMVNQVWVKFEISSKIRVFHISIVFKRIFLDSRVDLFQYSPIWIVGIRLIRFKMDFLSLKNVRLSRTTGSTQVL